MELIDKKKAMSHIESQYNQWGDDYDILQAIGDLEDIEPVNAIPVQFIQQRIDSLQELAEYELESNGGYVGKVHTEVYALRALINYWKAEQSAKDK